MARQPLIMKKTLSWGTIYYDTVQHSFSYKEQQSRSSEPYADQPVVLNVVITRQCNMDCDYCVAQDFAGTGQEDLALSSDMIRWLNRSPFMVLVLTGGEPLLPHYDAVSLRIIDAVTNKGLIMDTNGTLLPSRQVLSRFRERRVMIRVSMDALLPREESKRRHAAKGSKMDDRSAHAVKLDNIKRFISAGIFTAVQTVVWQPTPEPLYPMVEWLSTVGIKRWYLQRLIPSHRFKHPGRREALATNKYYGVVDRIVSEARSAGIECVAKKDLRHNSVFLLTGEGALYTQGNKQAHPGQKVRLGTIRDKIGYFDYVSAADHACRYYLAEQSTNERDSTNKLRQRLSTP